jgi:hypothetical protein
MTGIRRVSQLGTTGESTYVDGSIQAADIAANAITQDKLSTDIPLSGFRNVLINGGFDVWQRGTSFTGIANTTSYTADRWCIFRSVVAGYSLSQQAMVPSELSGFNYCARYQRTAGNTDLGVLYMGRTFESITVKALAGKAVTLSFYVRKGANFSGSTLSTAVDFGTGTDLGFTTQPTSPSSTTISTTLTASWQYVTSTIAVPTTATAARILFFYTPTGTAGAADYFEITGVQLEVGSQATPFEQRPIGTELALCQRYYEKFSATSIYTVYGSGLAGAVDSGTITMPFRVTKRVQPTLLDITGSCIMGDGVNNYTIYSLQLWTVSSPFAGGLLFTTPSSLTVGKFYSMFSNNNTTSAIAFSSEL